MAGAGASGTDSSVKLTAMCRTFVHFQIRHWRKNRARENCTGSILFRKNLCCEGVDLNRNYDFDFQQTLYPFNNPCSDEYQGPYPFSEPESRYVYSLLKHLPVVIQVNQVMP